MIRFLTSVSFLFIFAFAADVNAQPLVKDARNAFAKFNRSHDKKDLELAKKSIDDAFKTSKDSSSFKVNLNRALIYSALAVADSGVINDPKTDATHKALFSLQKLNNPKMIPDFQEDIDFIKSQLSKAYLNDINSHLASNNYEEAVTAFEMVDSLSGNKKSINHNIALLNYRIGNTETAVSYFKNLAENSSQPQYYLLLINIYESAGRETAAINTAENALTKFPENKDLLFYVINFYNAQRDYKKVSELIPRALKLEEFDIDLNYLAGFSFENIGQYQRAEEYYEKVLNSDPNNYDANYALGLLYLRIYALEGKKENLLHKSKQYLQFALEIDPNQIKTLQSLALLYSYNGDENQLRKINTKINQLKLN
ncbi:MAG: tetratricopeptide repeat protein [Daejeonella sp.]